MQAVSVGRDEHHVVSHAHGRYLGGNKYGNFSAFMEIITSVSTCYA